jgi:hypothetical protein
MSAVYYTVNKKLRVIAQSIIQTVGTKNHIIASYYINL